MNKKIAALIAALTLLVALGMLVGCGGNGADNTNADGAPNTEADTSNNQEGLPASFTAYGNTYGIDSFTLEEDENGNTLVVCDGYGFDVLPMRNGNFTLPLSCKLVVDGTEIGWTRGSAGGDGLEFEFEGSLTPTAVVFLSGDDDTQRVEVPVN